MGYCINYIALAFIYIFRYLIYSPTLAPVPIVLNRIAKSRKLTIIVAYIYSK